MFRVDRRAGARRRRSTRQPAAQCGVPHLTAYGAACCIATVPSGTISNQRLDVPFTGSHRGASTRDAQKHGEKRSISCPKHWLFGVVFRGNSPTPRNAMKRYPLPQSDLATCARIAAGCEQGELTKNQNYQSKPFEIHAAILARRKSFRRLWTAPMVRGVGGRNRGGARGCRQIPGGWTAACAA